MFGVVRASSVVEYASGKGVNVARVLAALDHTCTVLQFAGGQTGLRLQRELDSCGIACRSIPIRDATRICSTILPSSGYLEVIEPSPEITPQEWTRMVRVLDEVRDSFETLAVCGSWPGKPPAEFLQLLEKRPMQQRVYLDGLHGAESLLRAGIFCLKLNAMEIRQLAGIAEVEEAMSTLRARWPVEHVVVTDEDRAVRWLGPDGRAELQVEPAMQVQNPVGAGDSFLAGLIHEVENGVAMGAALQRAIDLAARKLRFNLPEDAVKSTSLFP